MLFIVSLLSVLIYHTVMREFRITAASGDWKTLTVDDRDIGGESFTEDLSSPQGMGFSFRTVDSDTKSYALFLVMPEEELQTVDLSWFQNVSLKAHLVGGSSQNFLFMIRDRADHLFDAENNSTRKCNEAYFELTSQPQTITLDRDSFMVSRWWVQENAALPSDSVSSFSQFEWLEIAICDPQSASEGTVVIDEICFSGPVMSPLKFYQGLFAAWLLLASLLSFGFLKKYKKRRAIRRFRLSQLAKMQSELPTPETSNLLESDTCEIDTYDFLTTVLTEFGLRQSIDQALQAVRNGDCPVSIVLFDVDDLTLLNESAGMASGDRLLQSVAAIAADEVGEDEILGRLGGDQFLIVCTGKDRNQSKALACRLRARIDRETTATCSFGVHQLNPINTFEESIERASRCVREAKFNGKNKVVLFSFRSPTRASLENRSNLPPFSTVDLEPQAASQSAASATK